MWQENPCIKCGACCAYFRVSFYWGETDEFEGGTVPNDLTEDVTPFYQCMKGTNQKNPRCVALSGEIGQQDSCKIYELRSSACREFGIQWDNGFIHSDSEELDRCNRARVAWDLPRLELPISRFAYHLPETKHLHRRFGSQHVFPKGSRGGRKAGGVRNI